MKHQRKNSTMWIESIFNATTAQFNGVVKRSIHSVTKHASEEQLVSAAKSRRFHVRRSRTHYLIFCYDPFELEDVC